MRLRVLLTDGTRTVDLVWLRHTGTDIYYGGVGWDDKTSYHASGKRHDRSKSGKQSEIEKHHPLNNFKDQMQLCVFEIPTSMVRETAATEYRGKKGDSVIWLDARTLPSSRVGISLGLVEVGGYKSILPVHLLKEFVDLRLVHLVTNTVPWIYVMVHTMPATAIPLNGDLASNE